MSTFADESDGKHGGGSGGASLFVGSFNINAEDLTITVARAWLKQAANADIVALGLQECGTLPAHPFPKPTNGMAKARWQSLKEASSSTHSAASSTSTSISRGSTETTGREAVVIEAFKWNTKHIRNRSTYESKMIPSEIVVPTAEVGGETTVEVDDSVDGSGWSTGSGHGDLEMNKATMRQESYYLRGAVDEDQDRQMLQNIADCIPGRSIVADVAMGETPTHGKMKVSLSPTAAGGNMFIASSCQGSEKRRRSNSCTEGDSTSLEHDKGSYMSNDKSNSNRDEGFATVEWYGTIRLLVFARKELYRDLSVRTVVIPSGDKPSCVGDAPLDYAKDTSPDKGAVACYLSDPQAQMDLLLVNCHLFGTNKYGVEEAVFDKHRMAQLRAINTALEASLPGNGMPMAISRMVLLGDLNFRVEMCNRVDDKAKGGKDFQSVQQVAEEGDAKSLFELYNKADRLQLVLDRRESSRGGVSSVSEGKGHSSDDEVPSLLWRLEDGLGAALWNGHLVRPTFTFKPNDTTNTPRRYNDKRTPSWTDRILWRGFAKQDCESQIEPHQSHHFAAVRDVISSDHEPVFCVLPL